MTDADKINQALAEMEGECVHNFEVGSERDYDGKIFWICKKCPRKIARFSHDPPVSSQFSIPDYLGNDAYILGLFRTLPINSTIQKYSDFYQVGLPIVTDEYGNYDTVMFFSDESLNRAIAKAALKKEGGEG